MTNPQALTWLRERTVSEVNRLLDGWNPAQIEHDGHTIATIKRAGCVFGSAFGSKDTIFDVMLHAMALAIAAGEMEIDAIEGPKPVVACQYTLQELNGPLRRCFRAVDHQGDHEDSLGHWRPTSFGDVQRT